MSDEPCSGVAALFNADLAVRLPEWAPRDRWIVIDGMTLRWLGDE